MMLTITTYLASTTKDLSFIPHNYWVVVVTSTLGGMTLNAILPLFYEFSVELTYPAPGGTILIPHSSKLTNLKVHPEEFCL
jgi:hypothetical protein